MSVKADFDIAQSSAELFFRLCRLLTPAKEKPQP